MKSVRAVFCPLHMIIRSSESSLKRILRFSSFTVSFPPMNLSAPELMFLLSLSNKRTINRTPCSLPLNCRDRALKSSEEAEDTRRCLKMSSALPLATKTQCPNNNNKAASDQFDVLLGFLFCFCYLFLALTQMLFLLKLAKYLVKDNVTRGRVNI